MNLPVRSILAIGIVAAAFAVYAFTTKLTFDQFQVITLPVITLYFGQFISPPGSVSVPRETVSDPVPGTSIATVDHTPPGTGSVTTTGGNVSG